MEGDDAAPGVGRPLGRVRLAGARLEHPLAVGDGQGQGERRRLLLGGHRHHLARAPWQQPVREAFQGGRLRVAGENLGDALEDGGAVVRGGLEGRVGDDQPVEGEHAQHDRGTRCEVPEDAGAGGAVHDDPVAVAGEEDRDHHGPPVEADGQRPGRDVVEQPVEPVALGPGALGVPAHRQQRGGGLGLWAPRAGGVGDHAHGGGGMPGQLGRRPDRTGDEPAVAVGADPAQVPVDAVGAERALEAADPGVRGVRGQVGVAALAGGAQVEHGVLLRVGRRCRARRSRSPSQGEYWPASKIRNACRTQDQYGARMARTAPQSVLTLRLPDDGAPLRHRIADALVAELRDGRLRPGDPLPSTRALAGSLGTSRGPVVAAYDELLAAGYIVTRAGSGAFVAPEADRAAAAGAASHVRPAGLTVPGTVSETSAPPRWDLRPGRPDTTLIDPAAWRRAWRAAATLVPGNDAGAGPEHTRLRAVLADHLRRSRGIPLAPDDILVVPGVAASLRALPAALGLVGRSAVLEDPGYVEAVTAFADSGVRVRTVPVDDDGLDPATLGEDDAAVYVTPSHQYPLGGRMPVGRRAELVAWAHRNGATVIEDDYDGEFRYDVSPLPALRALPDAAEHVVYIGTASKVLAPSLRVAWVVAPSRLRDRLRVALELRGLVVNEATGAALAEFVESGAMAAHHARAARTYAARRGALVAALGRHLPGVALAGVDAGLHVVLRLPDEADDLAVTGALLRAGLAASPLSAYCVERDLSGLVLCYAGLPESQADAAARALAAVVRG